MSVVFSALSKSLLRFFQTGLLAVGLLFVSGQLCAETLLITQVRIISGDSALPSPPQDVLIEQGKIKAIGATVRSSGRTLDGKGYYLIPGLIDSHVHLDGVPAFKGDESEHTAMLAEARYQMPRSYSYFGFTTLVDLTGSADFIADWNQQAGAPKAYFCAPLTIPDGYPAVWFGKEGQFHTKGSEYMLFNPAQGERYPADFSAAQHSPQAVVLRARQNGAHCIKVFYERGFGPLSNLPVPSVSLIQAVIKEAKLQNLPVLLHGNSLEAYKFALQTGVNTLVHGLWNMPQQTAPQQRQQSLMKMASRITAANIAVQPTIEVICGEQELLNPAFFRDPMVAQAIPAQLLQWYQSDAGQWMNRELAAHFGGLEQNPETLYQRISEAYQRPLATVRQMTKALYQQGSMLQFGSDTPSGPFYTQFPGINGRREMDRWLESGISLPDLFRAMTIGNTRALGLEQQIGQVKIGMQADLLLLRHNPLEDVKAYDSIEQVILKGQVFPRTSLSASQ